MIERMHDNLMRAADRAKDFMKAEESTKPALFVDFIGCLKVAAGSFHQLSMAQENPNFLAMRDVIEQVIDVGQSLPTFNGNQAGLWFKIKLSLEGIADRGKRMATSKAMSRQDVVTQLDVRQKALNVDG